jgi:hypothetical protein
MTAEVKGAWLLPQFRRRTMAIARDTVRTTCPRDCYDGCGIIVSRRDGVIRQVRGDPNHPVSRGKLCEKCSAAYNREWIDPCVRLTRPLRRVGAKGGWRIRVGFVGCCPWDRGRAPKVDCQHDRGPRDRQCALHGNNLPSGISVPAPVFQLPRSHRSGARHDMQHGWPGGLELRPRDWAQRL